MRRFHLARTEDVSGVSGTGVVAEGVAFTDGRVAIRWYGDNPSTVVWDSITQAMAVHGHNGATTVRWHDDSHFNHPYRHAIADHLAELDRKRHPEDYWEALAKEPRGFA